jgi:putative phosphoribosyl transferase
MVMQIFHDRSDAGRQLARRLGEYAGRPDVVVLGLPRGGVPVAFEVARALGVPLDVFVVRKLGVPGHEELAMGALASGGVRVLNEDVVKAANISDEEIEETVQVEREELAWHERLYRGERPSLDVRGQTVLVVDDGLATGSSMRAAITALRQLSPARIIVAIPVGALATCRDLHSQVDDLVCVYLPDPFFAVSAWYEDFAQTSDEEVQELLERAAREQVA